MMLSLVIPCYNEEENVGKFFSEVNRVFGENQIYDYEFVFVNDGSRDGTLKNLRGLYDRYHTTHNIQVLSFSRNFGKESAIYAGIQKARGERLCLIDADLQQRPEVVVEMLRHMEENPELDCVTAYQKERRENKLISGIKSLFYKIINKMSDVDFVNGASDFRLFKRQMAEVLIEMDEYHRFSKGLFSYLGFETKYIPYQVAQRESGESKWSVRSLFKYAMEGILAFSTAPLKIATGVGFFFSTASVIYMLVVLIQKLFFGIAVPGYATIVILILLLGGLQLFFLGVLGQYIARMYVQTKNRPIYILKEYLHSEDEKNEENGSKA